MNLTDLVTRLQDFARQALPALDAISGVLPYPALRKLDQILHVVLDTQPHSPAWQALEPYASGQDVDTLTAAELVQALEGAAHIQAGPAEALPPGVWELIIAVVQKILDRILP